MAAAEMGASRKDCRNRRGVAAERGTTHRGHGQTRGQWYVNGQGQTFVILDAGEFQMGSPRSEVGRMPNEDVHQRRIDRRFAISTKEVTKGQWRSFATSHDVRSADGERSDAIIRTDDSPMALITWYEAAWYCNWLSEQEGIAKDQWCYQPNEQGVFGPAHEGEG